MSIIMYFKINFESLDFLSFTTWLQTRLFHFSSAIFCHYSPVLSTGFPHKLRQKILHCHTYGASHVLLHNPATLDI